MNIESLNRFLNEQGKIIFRVENIKIILNKGQEFELFNFFQKNSLNDIFINDIVFLEENKDKFDVDKIKNELGKGYIFFPMKDNKGNLVGVFELGKKTFGEQYYSEEIKILKDLTNFLTGHLKYIKIYEKINYLNVNLNKEVDKKTMQYNILINKQKEFISLASHEIKTPIMSVCFNVEEALSELKEGKIKEANKSLESIKTQVYKLMDLSKLLFSSQKYEMGKISLYLEKVRLKDLFQVEINNITNLVKNLKVKFHCEDSVTYISADKVQISQVLSNLLSNGAKFGDKDNPKIYVGVYDLGDKIKIVMEDNGNGFENDGENQLFEKYNTGIGDSIGLGLGLYLCKKIVEKHGGKIYTLKGEVRGGARIEVILFKEIK